MGKIKILHIVPTYLPAYRYGGPIESVHNLNKWLVKKGAEVTVYTTNIDGADDLRVPTGVPVDVDGVRVFYFKNSFPRRWFYSRDMRRALCEHMPEFDIVHITSVFLAASTLGAYYARKFGKPYVISPRGNLMRFPLAGGGWLRWLKKWIYIFFIEKRNLRGAAAVHFTSREEGGDYKSAGFSLVPAIVLPNGIDPKDFEPMPRGSFRKTVHIGDDKKLILFLGRLNWMKGFDILIPAFAEIIKKEPKAMLVIVGGDEDGYKKEIEDKIKEYELEAHIRFTGMLRGKDKDAVLSDSDLFVLPSFSENFGMAAIEAMHAGLPVVVSPNVGTASVIAGAGAGIKLEKRDSRELAEKMLYVLKNKELGKKMGSHGIELVAREFYEDKIAERFLAEYNKLIAR